MKIQTDFTKSIRAAVDSIENNAILIASYAPVLVDVYEKYYPPHILDFFTNACKRRIRSHLASISAR